MQFITQQTHCQCEHNVSLLSQKSGLPNKTVEVTPLHKNCSIMSWITVEYFTSTIFMLVTAPLSQIKLFLFLYPFCYFLKNTNKNKSFIDLNVHLGEWGSVVVFFFKYIFNKCKIWLQIVFKKKKTIIACQKEIDLQSFSDDTSRRNPQP